MTDRQPMQADGEDKPAGEGKDVAGQMASGGQSGGAAYPDGMPSAEEGGFLDDGSASETAHHGGDRPGEESVEDAQEVRDRAR